MIRRTLVDELVRGITETVVKLGSVKDDVEKQVRATITATLDRLDVVTRDEYEVQQAMASRLRERLESLEQRVVQLEERGAEKKSGKNHPKAQAADKQEQWANDEPGQD